MKKKQKIDAENQTKHTQNLISVFAKSDRISKCKMLWTIENFLRIGNNIHTVYFNLVAIGWIHRTYTK